jgi:hypothetical protein
MQRDFAPVPDTHSQLDVPDNTNRENDTEKIEHYLPEWWTIGIWHTRMYLLLVEKTGGWFHPDTRQMAGYWKSDKQLKKEEDYREPYAALNNNLPGLIRLPMVTAGSYPSIVFLNL